MNGWDGLQASFKPVCYVPYRGSRIYVYQSLDDERHGADNSRTLYYCTPILMLEPDTAEYQFMILKRAHVVSFDVVMWSEEARSAVLDYMHKELKMSVGRVQVNPLSFAGLKLTCWTLEEANAPRCPDEWQSYHMQNVVTFHLICPTKDDAEPIADAMKKQPKQFKSAFEMQLKLSTRQTGRQETTMSEEQLLNEELYSESDLGTFNTNEALPRGFTFSRSSDVVTVSVNINTDAKMRNFHLDGDFGARMPLLEEQSKDWKFGLEVLEKETARRMDALNKNLDQLTQRMVNIERILNNNSNPNNQLTQRMAKIERLMKDNSNPNNQLTQRMANIERLMKDSSKPD